MVLQQCATMAHEGWDSGKRRELAAPRPADSEERRMCKRHELWLPRRGPHSLRPQRVSRGLRGGTWAGTIAIYHPRAAVTRDGRR